MDDATIIGALRDHDSPAWRAWEQDGFWRAVLAAADRIEALGREVALYKAIEEKLKGISLDDVVDAFVRILDQHDPEPLRKARIIWNADADWREQLIADRDQWRKQAEAAIADLKLGAVDDPWNTTCYRFCKHANPDDTKAPYCLANFCRDTDEWEWRGPCAENTAQPAQGAPFDEPMGGDKA
jgi:hypothetical protein